MKFSAVIRADRCRSIPTVSRLLLRPFSRKHTPLKIVTPSAIQCRRGETGLNNVDHSAEYKQTCSCVATEFYALAPAGMGKGGGMPSIGKCKGQTRFNYNLLVRTKTTKIVDKHASPVQIASMAGAPPLAR